MNQKTGIFTQIKEEAILQRLNQRMWRLFLEIVKAITEIFEETDEIQLFEKILQDEQVYEKISRLFGNAGNIKNAA